MLDKNRVQEVIAHASEKGYFASKDDIAELLTKQDIILFIELELLRRWLSQNHKIHIAIGPTDNEEGTKTVQWGFGIIFRYDNSIDDDAFSVCNDSFYDTEDEALLAACSFATDSL